jgi:hypothetical protein
MLKGSQSLYILHINNELGNQRRYPKNFISGIISQNEKLKRNKEEERVGASWDK